MKKVVLILACIVLILVSICLLIGTFLRSIQAHAPLHDANEEIEWRNAYASNPDNPYDPNIYAYEASRGELRDCYFGIRLDDLEKDQDGNYVMSEAQRDTLIKKLIRQAYVFFAMDFMDTFREVTLTPDGTGTMKCSGGQQSTENDDYLSIDGYIEPVSPLHLKFTGKIVTRVGSINNGQPVVRNGQYNFLVRGARSYWRMQEISNPTDGCADYVDIYFD